MSMAPVPASALTGPGERQHHYILKYTTVQCTMDDRLNSRRHSEYIYIFIYIQYIYTYIYIYIYIYIEDFVYYRLTHQFTITLSFQQIALMLWEVCFHQIVLTE